MCWKFHGKMPSHRKQEKRRQKEEMEQKQMRVSVGLNPSLIAGPDAKRQLGSLSAGASKKPKKI